MKKHFLIRENHSSSNELRAACAHYFEVPDDHLTENTKEVTCGLCRLTHAFKEAIHLHHHPIPESASPNEEISNVVELFPNTPADAIINALLRNHKQGNIKSLSVAYTLTDSPKGICESHVEAVTDATSMIGMLEYNKTAVIEILKRHIDT